MKLEHFALWHAVRATLQVVAFFVLLWALIVYPPLGIGTLLLALATAGTAFFQHTALSHALPMYLTAILWIVHLLITLLWALPTLPRQRQVADDEQQLATIFHQFERLQTIRAALDVLIFASTLWALVSYLP